MAKGVDIEAVDSLQAITPQATAAGAASYDAVPVAAFAETAMMSFCRDLERFHPNKPALAYALAGETHAALMQKWRLYAKPIQQALLTALRDDLSDLLRRLQSRLARVAPDHGYMFGLHEEAIKLETQADITLEEIRRLEAALHALELGTALQ